MVDCNKNEKIASALRSWDDQIEDFINVICGIFNQYLSKADSPLLGYSIKKSKNDIANIVKKQHDFVK